jgi:hypothetical protein
VTVRRDALLVVAGAMVANAAVVLQPSAPDAGEPPPVYAAGSAGSAGSATATIETVIHDNEAPRLVAHVAHAARVPAADIVIADRGQPDRWARATAVRDGRVAVALVVQDTADYLGVGSDATRPDGSTGARLAIEGMLSRAALVATAPADSVGTLVGYGEKVTQHVHVSPLPKLAMSAVKPSTPIAARRTTGLVAALETAVHDVGTSPPASRFVVLIGDGSAPATATPLLAQLRERADGDDIIRMSLAYGEASTATAYSVFDPHARAASDPEEVLELGDDLRAAVADRYDVDLPGVASDRGPGLDWDGGPHALVLHLGALGPVAVERPLTLPGYRAPGPRTARAAFGAVAIAGVLVALFGLASLARQWRRR